MILEELKTFINNLPPSMSDFTVVNGEFASLIEDGEELTYFRVDKPIVVLTVDEENKEILILHQSEEEIDKIMTDDGITK
jgi:hypothetical protein